MVDGAMVLQEGKRIFVLHESDLPGYKAKERNLDLRLNGWEFVGEADVPEGDIHKSSHGKVTRIRLKRDQQAEKMSYTTGHQRRQRSA